MSLYDHHCIAESFLAEPLASIHTYSYRRISHVLLIKLLHSRAHGNIRASRKYAYCESNDRTIFNFHAQ